MYEYREEDKTLIFHCDKDMQLFTSTIDILTSITNNEMTHKIQEEAERIIYNEKTGLCRFALSFIALGLKNLKNIDICKENEKYKSINGIVYTKDEGSLIFCPSGKTGIVKILDGVSVIDSDAFISCQLTEIAIPDSVEIIGDNTFGDCRNLKHVTFTQNSHLHTVDTSAFYGCKSLKELTLPNSVVEMGNTVFQKSGIEKFTFPTSIEYPGNYLFYDSNIREIIVPKVLFQKRRYFDILESCFDNSDSNSGAFIFTVGNAIPIVVPKNVEAGTYKSYNIKNSIDAFLSQKDAIPPDLYKYGESELSKEDAAFLQYQFYQTKSSRRSLILKWERIAKRKAKQGEEAFMQFLSLDVWKPDKLQEILKIAEENGFAVATGYILEKLKKESRTKRNIPL